MKLRLKILGGAAAVVSLLAVGGTLYVTAHPLIFNESFFEHAHCIAIADGMLRQYAVEHSGRFPFSTNGYGDALLQIDETGRSFQFMTGPCYNEGPFVDAFKSHKHLREADCGRVYIQGLTLSNKASIVILYDKIPTPGGDHCHWFQRFKQPLGREVALVGGHDYVGEREWPAFVSNQVELLVQAGFSREQAEDCYKPNRR